jgi:hypothetical protein
MVIAGDQGASLSTRCLQSLELKEEDAFIFLGEWLEP